MFSGENFKKLINVSFKDQRRKRILGGQRLGISSLEHAASPFLVALSPQSPLLQASRVTFLNQIWPSHSPPSTLLCPHHSWDKIQIPKDSQHSRSFTVNNFPVQACFPSPEDCWMVPEYAMCVHTSGRAFCLGCPPWLTNASSFFKTQLKCPLLPQVFPEPLPPWNP